MHADIELAADDSLTLAAANELARSVQRELAGHLPALSRANVTFVPADLTALSASTATAMKGHHAPQPFQFEARFAKGSVEIIDTPSGERMRLTLDREAPNIAARAEIDRLGGKTELLELKRHGRSPNVLQSRAAPAEPHEFDAKLFLELEGQQEILSFGMTEPAGHQHR